MMDARPVLIMAGGTGGHVFPALAVAEELQSRGIPVVWLGTRAGIESRLVPEAGYPIEWMSITGLRGKNTLTLFLAPLRIVMACWQALVVLFKRKPCAVLGIVHEQNAIAGLTNKILAKLSTTVLQAFPSVFKRGVTMGNPVRQSICEIEKPETRYSGYKSEGQSERLRLLIVGGSLGAAKLNEVVPQALNRIDKDRRPDVIHQTGLKNIEAAEAFYSEAGVDAKVEAFIDDMSSVYEWADLVICRAGAMTVFELAAAGIASVLVPYPYAVDDHQTSNAKYLEDAGAAIIKQQDELTADNLAEIINDFEVNRTKLFDMAVSARKLAIPDSAKNIADACLVAGGVA